MISNGLSLRNSLNISNSLNNLKDESKKFEKKVFKNNI
jgi:hypothetical protein